MRPPVLPALIAAALVAVPLWVGPAAAQNLPGQGGASPQTNIHNYTLKNQSGQVITKAQASFSNGDAKSVAPASGIQPSQGQSFGEDQRACLIHLDVTLKDGTALTLDHPTDCKLAVLTVGQKSITVNSSASLQRPLSD